MDEEDLADMPEEFHYEPELALGSGVDGLEITKQIFKTSAGLFNAQWHARLRSGQQHGKSH